MEDVLDRFLRYVKIDTQSEENGEHPSTGKQFDLARLLAAELRAMGASEVSLDEDYWLLDRRGKMLGTVTQTEAEKYPEIRNLEPITAIAGTEMIVEGADEARLAYLTELLTPLKAEGMLPYIQWIDLKNTANPSLRLDGRILVYLGEMSDTAYKVALLRDVTEQLSREDTGTLYFAGGNTWTFSPD